MRFEDRLRSILKASGCEYSVEDLLFKIEKKEIVSFEYLGVLILIEVQQFPQKKVLHIWGMEGEGALSHLTEIVSWLKNLALALGCEELRCQGRAGWERALRSLGAAPLYTTLSMKVS